MNLIRLFRNQTDRLENVGRSLTTLANNIPTRAFLLIIFNSEIILKNFSIHTQYFERYNNINWFLFITFSQKSSSPEDLMIVLACQEIENSFNSIWVHTCMRNKLDIKLKKKFILFWLNYRNIVLFENEHLILLKI